MPRIDALAVKDLDLATLLALAERRAVAEADGHLTLLRFTTGWKCLVGTPDLDSGAGRHEVWALPAHPTVQDALLGCLIGDPCNVKGRVWPGQP